MEEHIVTVDSILETILNGQRTSAWEQIIEHETITFVDIADELLQYCMRDEVMRMIRVGTSQGYLVERGNNA